MPLADFGKSFKLDQAKEVMPYKLYTKAFIKEGGLASLEQIKNTPDFEDHNQLMRNLIEWGCAKDGKFDMIKYASIYCKADVEVLKKGWIVFRDYPDERV